MYNLTFTSLERLHKLYLTVNIEKYPSSVQSTIEHQKRTLGNMVTEAKMLYAVTLRYPTITIDPKFINTVIKVIKPSQDQLAELYDSFGGQ